MKRRSFLKTLTLLPLAMKIAMTEPVLPKPVVESPWKWLEEVTKKVWEDWNRMGYYYARFESFPAPGDTSGITFLHRRS